MNCKFKNKQFLTIEIIAIILGCDVKNVEWSFAKNQHRFIQDKHYEVISESEMKLFGTQYQNRFTLKGIVMLSMPIDTDQSWAIYEKIIDGCFDIQALLPTKDNRFDILQKFSLK